MGPDSVKGRDSPYPVAHCVRKPVREILEIRKNRFPVVCLREGADSPRRWRLPVLTAIERPAMPDWLQRLTAESMRTCTFPLQDVLHDSLYYAGAGCDGRPVKYFGGNVHSFVYSDYLYAKASMLDALHSPETRFLGYRILGIREVPLRDVFPGGWFRPEDMDPCLTSNERLHSGAYMNGDSPDPYAVWVVFERDAGRPARPGPFRFSLLHVCVESVAAYAGLYRQNGIVPRMLFLLNHGFGGNWTNFEKQSMVFARTVASHPDGLPLYLAGRVKRAVYSGQGTASVQSCWPDLYPGMPLCEAWPEGFHVWKRTRRIEIINSVRRSFCPRTRR